MAIILNRQISDSEKNLILSKHGRRCFATGHVIPAEDEIHFDHIKAFADGGASEIDNIAPMCKQHNLQKGRLPLEDFRTKLRIDDFFSKGQGLTLKHELAYLKEKKNISNFGESVFHEISGSTIELEFLNKREEFRLYTCPTTNWQYFYAILPVDIINSDDGDDGEIGLQPRYLISDKVFNLYRHFQRNTVLHPSIARLYKNKILVFDGQHKIASLLWNDQKRFELKVYLNPESKSLNQTNISAHDKFSQTRFFASVMVTKLGSQFGKYFEEYKNTEDGVKKTESGFVSHIRVSEQLTNAEVNKRFTSFLYDSILDEAENKITKFVSKGNRGSDEYPLTIDMLSKSIFANFLYRYPTDDDLAGEYYKRDEEVSNVIHLCNIIHDEILHNWESSKSKDNLNQNQLNRMFRSKSIMAWSELLKDAIAAKLEIYDTDEKQKLFYRKISSEDFEKIKFIFRRLAEWKMWKETPNSDIDRILSDNKSEVKKYFRDNNLNPGYLLGVSN